jgi:methyl-accepting chemotaxis protein
MQVTSRQLFAILAIVLATAIAASSFKDAIGWFALVGVVAIISVLASARGDFEATQRKGDDRRRSLIKTIASLRQSVATQRAASAESARLLREAAGSFTEAGKRIDHLLGATAEATHSVNSLDSDTHEVAEHAAELAKSVRETVSSLEQMAYAIREVAKNVDALSLTAEETSSSMNEMDLSIDQVQSNANETARLSEEVTRDAEKGTEAIVKTMSEIYRIKESSLEAVSAISTLGSRIDAIGQIVNVIDDVAEQTNLLALNAAIIAAQAGEHGKGFAVVADEIKDLAERAAASTREITDLIKTVQGESRNAISAVERGAANVDRGVEVSNEAERTLKKILESSHKSTNMVRAIARATVEQSKGSKQVTDAIGRIAQTVQQIAASTTQHARGSELVMRGAEKMRVVTQAVERGAQGQAQGTRKIASTITGLSEGIAQVQQTIAKDLASPMRHDEGELDALIERLADEASHL